MSTCRDDIGRALVGDVLEIGPGTAPFPTAPEARVTFADRPLPCSRDEAFPELAGTPYGPAADVLVDLDTDGLRPLPDRSFDVVIASHVIEHLAAPIAALAELQRVLRPGGRLVLVVPDRTRTFDAERPPTPLAHLLDEHRAGVSTVSDAHIREFHLSTTAEPRVPAGEQHAATVGPDLIELHRLRTIHVHCWTPEEMMATLTGLAVDDLVTWKLVDLYFADDRPGVESNEFGLVLVRPDPDAGPATGESPHTRAHRFVEDWCRLVLDEPRRDPRRLAALTAALHRDLDRPGTAGIVARPAEILAGLTAGRAAPPVASAEPSADLQARLDEAGRRIAALERSNAYRAGRLVTAPLRVARAGVRGGLRQNVTRTVAEQVEVPETHTR